MEVAGERRCGTMSDYFDHLLAYLPLGCGNCVSVYASVTRQSSIKTVGRIELDFSIEVLMFDLSYAVLENSFGYRYFQSDGYFPPEFCPKRWIHKTSLRHVNRRKSCQLSPTKVEAQCDKTNSDRRPVIGRAKLTILATVDVRPTTVAIKFITLSVHLCVQRDAREATRRAGPSATADICSGGSMLVQRGEGEECTGLPNRG